MNRKPYKQAAFFKMMLAYAGLTTLLVLVPKFSLEILIIGLSLYVLILISSFFDYYKNSILARLIHVVLASFLVFGYGVRYILTFATNAMIVLSVSFVLFLVAIFVPLIDFRSSQRFYDKLSSPSPQLKKALEISVTILIPLGYWIGKAIAAGDPRAGTFAGFLALLAGIVAANTLVFPIWKDIRRKSLKT